MRWIDGEDGAEIILSPGERKLLRLVLSGLQNKEIAHTMGISEHTVKSNLQELCSLLGLHNRVELCKWVMTYPHALAGLAAHANVHAEGCECPAPYCSTQRIGEVAA